MDLPIEPHPSTVNVVLSTRMVVERSEIGMVELT
jgi:hypothetical protein